MPTTEELEVLKYRLLELEEQLNEARAELAAARRMLVNERTVMRQLFRSRSVQDELEQMFKRR